MLFSLKTILLNVSITIIEKKMSIVYYSKSSGLHYPSLSSLGVSDYKEYQDSILKKYVPIAMRNAYHERFIIQHVKTCHEYINDLPMDDVYGELKEIGNKLYSFEVPICFLLFAVKTDLSPVNTQNEEFSKIQIIINKHDANIISTLSDGLFDDFYNKYKCASTSNDVKTLCKRLNWVSNVSNRNGIYRITCYIRKNTPITDSNGNILTIIPPNVLFREIILSCSSFKIKNTPTPLFTILGGSLRKNRLQDYIKNNKTKRKSNVGK